MKKLARYFFLLMMLCIVLTGCSVMQGKNSGKKDTEFWVYYMDQAETKLERRTYEPKERTSEYLLKDLTQRLNGGAVQESLKSLLPENVEILSYQVDKNHLNLILDQSYNEMSISREVLVRAGIVKTYLQIQGIDSVQFFIGKESLKNSRGEEIGRMTEATFAEFSTTDMDSYRYDTLVLFFTDKTGTKLVAEERNLYYKRNLPREQVILEQLAKGPMVEGHYPVIAENTEVMSVTKADGVCYVEFNHVFVDHRLSIPGETAVYAVANSILKNTNDKNMEKVQILINGNPEVNFGEEFSLYNFFGWNESLIEKE